MKEGKVTYPKELTLDELLVSYDQFLKGSLNRGSIETIRALLDTLEHMMDGSYACCHIVGGDNTPYISDIYSSRAERAVGSVVLQTNGGVPVREDHWMECVGPKEPVFHEGRSIITCKRKGSEYKFDIDGILSVPIVRSEKVEVVISIANVRHPGQKGIERLVLAANIGWSICEVKRFDEALRDSEARLKQAQRMGRMGNWVWDLEGNSLHWSDELYELYGVDPRTFQLTYDNILSRIHPEDRERNARTVDMILEDRIGTSFDFRIVRSDSTIRSIHQVIEVETDHEGSIKRLIGTMLDVTELDELRSAIEESRDQLKVMFDQTPIMMCLLDGDRRITFCNKAFEEASGWPNTEFGSLFACGALGCINSLDDIRGCGFGPKCRSCNLFNAIEETWRTGSNHNDVEYSTILSRDGKMRELVLLGSTTKVRIGSKDMILLSLQD
ncbi:MAG: PAS domain-containing protein, partial [Candidatus Thermoplasmatota archaeon]|nr:PAS domain-containing protein [Candidatus Thermoplasmatota archaeon]